MITMVTVQKDTGFYLSESLDAYYDYRRQAAMGITIAFSNTANRTKFSQRYPYVSDDVATNLNV